MSDYDLRFIYGAEPQRFVEGTRSARSAADQYDQALRRLSGNQLTLAKSGTVLSASTKNHIGLRQALNALGVQTVQQIRDEIAVIDQLAAQIDQRETPALNHLAAVRAQLVSQTQANIRSNRNLGQGFFSLGYIIDDASQFSYGFAQGMRAVSNNVLVAAQQFGIFNTASKASLATMIGLQVAVTTLVVLGPKIQEFFDRTGGSANAFDKEVGGATSSLFDFRVESERTFAIRGQAAIEDYRRALRQIALGYRESKKSLGEQGAALDQNIRNLQRFVGLNPGLQADLDKQLQARSRIARELQETTKNAEVLAEVEKEINTELARREVARRAEALATAGGRQFPSANQQALAELITGPAAENERLRFILEALKGLRAENVRAINQENEALQEQIDTLLGLNEKEDEHKSLLETLREDYRDLTVEIRARTGAHAGEVAEIERAIESAERYLEVQEKLRRLAAGFPDRLKARAPSDLVGAGDLKTSFFEHLRQRSLSDATARNLGFDPEAFRQQFEEAGIIPSDLGSELRQLSSESQQAFMEMQAAHAESVENMKINWASYVLLHEGSLATIDTISQNVFGSFADLARTAYQASGREAEGWFRTMKAFQIAETIIHTYRAATQALPNIPLAASIVVAGLANVAKIAATEPGSRGGGGGGTRHFSIYQGQQAAAFGSDAGATVSRSPVDPNLGRLLSGGSGLRIQVQGVLSAERGSFSAAINEGRVTRERSYSST